MSLLAIRSRHRRGKFSISDGLTAGIHVASIAKDLADITNFAPLQMVTDILLRVLRIIKVSHLSLSSATLEAEVFF
jgi:hypothetical protein